MKLLHRCFFALALAAFTGCVTPEPRVPLTGNIMIDGPKMIAGGRPQDKVLWQYRTAAAAMRLGDFAQAKQLLDDALLTTGGISTDRSARQARSYFRPEGTKAFIGEPYERAMAYYYRGILYWMDGEADNARACFRSAAIQDGDAENREYAADYAILDYLDGFATQKLGGDGADAFQRATNVSRLSRLPAYDRDANVLFLIEFGRGPVKYATGEYEQELRFRAAPTPIHTAVITVSGQRLVAGAVDDLQFQATTRGGRVMDHVLGNKAVFKTTTSIAGDAGIISGAVLASQRNRNSAVDEVGAGLLVAGILTKLVSAAAIPAADTRSWDNLPRYLSFAHLKLPPGQHEATVEFRDSTDRAIPGLTKTITINVPPDRTDKVVFVSDQSSTPQTI